MTEKKAKKKTREYTSKTKKETASAKANPNTRRRRRTDRGGSSRSRANQRRREVKRQKILLILLAFVILIGLFLFFTRIRNKGSVKGVTSDVLQYQPQVEAWCKEFGIEEYSTLLLALMQQESSGQGTDVFQCSESPFNTEYSNDPGSIADTDYSIQVGVQTFAYCLKEAKCKSINDTDGVYLALQEYNFGNSYASWALENYGGYSEENALEFSEMMKYELGWDTYGDPQYVSHVMQYYER